MQKLYVNEKEARAKVITAYLKGRRTFCFSCGNATKELKRAGANLIAIDKTSQLQAKEQIKPEQAEHYFQAFNSTSGNIPLFLLERIANSIYKQPLKQADNNKTLPIYVPVGSGELLLVLMFLFPSSRLHPFSSSYAPLRFGRADCFSPLSLFLYAQFPNFEDFGNASIEQIFQVVKDRPGYFIYTEKR
jgi:hypothetical protein